MSARQFTIIGTSVVLLAVAAIAPVGPSGDSIEYVSLARQIVHHGRVTFSPAEANSLGISFPEFLGADGRQDLWHFWIYPLLVAPLVAVSDALGLNPVRAFSLFNGVLLVALGILLVRRVGPLWTVVLLGGPIVWWIPHAQVEVFTFAGIAAGSALFVDSPAWAAVMFGIASTQNPALAALALLCSFRAVMVGVKSRGDAVAIAIAMLLSALHPTYYLWHLGRPTPLVGAAESRLPGARALLSPLIDLNVGLFWRAPLSGALLVWSFRPRRTAASIFIAASVALLLIAFAQAPNVNHGGTPSLSRYALWLIPLPLVVLRPSNVGAVVKTLAIATVAWTMVFFRPTLPESHLRPTALAEWVWESHPAWDNPLPEVFAERLRHSEPAHTIAATPNCAKVLTTEGAWPTGCRSVPVPEACLQPGAMCYGNRRADGAYEFARVSRR